MFSYLLKDSLVLKKQILSTAKVYKERKLEPPPLTLEEEAIEVGDPTLATDYVEADVDVTEQIDTSNKPYSFTVPPMIEETLSETEINEREDLKNLEAYIQNEIDTTGTLPLEAIENINNISLDNIKEDTRSKIEQGKIIRAENPNILQEESVSGFKEFTPESFSSDFEEFATEVTESSPEPVKEKLKDFKLRREGRDIPVLDNQKTNVAEIIAQQQLSIGLFSC